MSCPTLFSCFSLPELLKSVNDGASALAAIFVIVGMLAGRKAVRVWEERKKIERKMNHAERIMIAVYNARSALTRIRNPFSNAYEQNIAIQNLKEVFGKEDNKDFGAGQISGMTCINRWDSEKEFYDEIYDCIPIARAFFERDLYFALNDIVKLFNNVRFAAGSLVEQINDDAYYQDLRERIYGISFKDEANTDKGIDEQIAIVESILLPILRIDNIDIVKLKNHEK